MSCLDFTQFQKEHGEWSDKTFGLRNPTAPLHHLQKEVKEVINEPFDIEEYADCFLLLMDSARIAGFNMDDLFFAAKRKFEKNKRRTWGKPDENGVVEHIRCITFDKAAQDSLPEHIKAKMKADREKARIENNSTNEIPKAPFRAGGEQ